MGLYDMEQARKLDRAFLDFRSKGVAAKAAAQAVGRQHGVSEATVLCAYEICQGQRVNPPSFRVRRAVTGCAS